jgi:hypothetical protein
MNKLTCRNKQLKLIPSNRHGILNENIGDTWGTIDVFMKECINETNTGQSGRSLKINENVV